MRIKFQFGLKWFLLATTFVAVLVGTVGKRLYDRWQNNLVLERRARAIRELEEFGVRAHIREGVVFRLQFPQQVCKTRHFEMAAEIGDLEWIDLDYTGFRDADAPTLLANPNLKTLSLSANPGITDVSLITIAQISSLEALDLSVTTVTDQGLKEVARLRNLERLHLTRTAITSSGVNQLRPLQSVRILSLMYTNVDDEALQVIGELNNLEVIFLDHTKVRGGGIAALAKLPKLRFLHLRGCPLEDGSGLANLKQVTHLTISDTRISLGVLSHLREMDSLRNLDLSGSAINDEHLLELGGVKQLTHLSVGKKDTPGGPVYPQDATVAGFRRLRAELPNTRIVGIPSDR